MLEHLPTAFGRALRGVRAGHAGLATARIGRTELNAGGWTLDSADFADGAPLPTGFTADGTAPVCPALTWSAPPAGTRSLLLIVEDADVPARKPFVHYLAWGMEPRAGALGQGEAAPFTGQNSYAQRGWLPPDPPPGHGAHDYVFQLFALDTVLALDEGAGRAAVLKAAADHVLGVAVLTGTYARPD